MLIQVLLFMEETFWRIYPHGDLFWGTPLHEEIYVFGCLWDLLMKRFSLCGPVLIDRPPDLYNVIPKSPNSRPSQGLTNII